jgi:hypothetical protein
MSGDLTVLVPTPAQLAVGQRVIWVDDGADVVPGGARSLMTRLRTVGLVARASYALAVLAPGGRLPGGMKRYESGLRVETVAVRWHGAQLVGAAIWTNGYYSNGGVIFGDGRGRVAGSLTAIEIALGTKVAKES